jgi:hypothetical protein
LREPDKRIPTIFSVLPTTPKPKPKKASKPLLKAIADRIQSREALYRELLSLWGCDKNTRVDQRRQLEHMTLLARIVAQALLDAGKRGSVKREKDLSVGLERKTAATWRNRVIEGAERSARLRKFMRAILRRGMAQDKNKISNKNSAPYDRDPFRRLAVNLYDYFSMLTPRPYRYMAAISGLFNLHPKGFCRGCTHFRAQRKPFLRHKNKSLATKVREGTHMCKLENILACPHHTTGRQSLEGIIDSKISP